MNSSDLFNVTLFESKEGVDKTNKKFYGTYNFPWPPSVFPEYPVGKAVLFINQDLGYWNDVRVAAKPKIWVAGCGSNQALFTALKFPESEVYATDISPQSINICKKNANQMEVSNLYFEEKSINEINYKEEFDYIICTGVVYHNANPEITLNKISSALKKDGILELMVYNYYHRILTTSCQKAIRTFYDSKLAINIEFELSLIKNLISDFQYDGLMGDFLRSHIGMNKVEMADRLVQPVEYSYTIESLGNLIDNCNLEYLLHCQNQFDIERNAFTWNMKFQSDYLSNYYNSLPDLKRWQISNLLMCNDSPYLWFYLQKKDASFKRKTEQQVCEEFLETKFRKNSFSLKHYVLDTNGNYKLKAIPSRYPSEKKLKDPILRKVFYSVSPSRKMKDVFYELNIRSEFYEVNQIRIKLSTSGYPYLLVN